MNSKSSALLRNRLHMNEEAEPLQSGTVIAATRQTNWDLAVDKERQVINKYGGMAAATVIRATTVVESKLAEYNQEQQEHHDLVDVSGSTVPVALNVPLVPTPIDAVLPSPSPQPYRDPAVAIFRDTIQESMGTEKSESKGIQDKAAAHMRQTDTMLMYSWQEAIRRLANLEKEEEQSLIAANSSMSPTLSSFHSTQSSSSPASAMMTLEGRQGDGENGGEEESNVASRPLSKEEFFTSHGMFVIRADVSCSTLASELELEIKI
ncbi:hypothetical protein BGW42_006423 [Actinomortierella wolfii]|nr:hypothetical protein BGW42_006423 [Actinomortierella wolfii]